MYIVYTSTTRPPNIYVPKPQGLLTGLFSPQLLRVSMLNGVLALAKHNFDRAIVLRRSV